MSRAEAIPTYRIYQLYDSQWTRVLILDAVAYDDLAHETTYMYIDTASVRSWSVLFIEMLIIKSFDCIV